MYQCKCGGMQFRATAIITADATVTTKSGCSELVAGTQNTREIRFNSPFTCVRCSAVHMTVDEPDSGNAKRCACGNTSFTAHQVCRHDVIVNGDNIFDRDDGIYDAEHPYGPYCCTVCGAEYDELDELDKFPQNKKGAENA